MNYRVIYILVLLSAGMAIQAQSRQDTLLSKLRAEGNDSVKCLLLAQLMKVVDDEDAWQRYNQELRVISEINLKRTLTASLRKFFRGNLADAYSNEGYYATEKADFPKAMKLYQDALKIDLELNNKKNIADTYNNLSELYAIQGNTQKEYEYLQKSLELKLELKDTNGLSGVYNNFGAFYRSLGDTSTALDYYKKAWQLQEATGDKFAMARTANNMGQLLSIRHRFDEAKKYFAIGLAICEEIHDVAAYAGAISNLGQCYKSEGNIKQAEECYRKGLALRRSLKNKSAVAHSLILLAKLYFERDEWRKAQVLAEEAMQLSREVSFPRRIRDASDVLYKVYKKLGMTVKALEMHELLVTMTDSVNNEEARHAVMKNTLRLEFEKKAIADSLQTVHLRELSEAKVSEALARLKQERLQRLALYGGLAIVLIFSGIIFQRLKITRRQKQIIEHKEKETKKQNIIITEQKHLVEQKQYEILSSIRYARRIQQSLLPGETYIRKSLERLRGGS